MDPKLIKRFGEIASREYRALGITTALSPQVDLATDPRWRRNHGCFSEDPQLVTDYARAYCDGFQSSTGEAHVADGWGYHSVNAMMKHWPGGGSEEGGRDSHYSFGKFAVYPGGMFNTSVTAVFAQSPVSGRVTDAAGNPVAGVFIIAEGTNATASTEWCAPIGW